MMNTVMNKIWLTMTGLAMVLGMVTFANAQRGNDRDIRDAVRSLNSEIDDFEFNLREEMRSSSAPSRDIALASDDVRNLKNAVRDLESNLDRRRDNRDDVERVLTAARRIDSFVTTGSHSRRVTDEWLGVKRQIDRLASNYGVSANWSRTSYDPRNTSSTPYPQQNVVTGGLTGTYQLDSTRSENIDEIIADAGVTGGHRDELREKLLSPDNITIDLRGNHVTLGFATGQTITLMADGSQRTERTPDGRTVRVRATRIADTLTVSTLSDGTDHTITFSLMNGGRDLKVTRRVTTEYLPHTLIAESFYTRTDSVARVSSGGTTVADSGGYSDNDQNSRIANGGVPTIGVNRTGDFIVPNGTIITGTLENEINTKVSQNNDRFRMTVQSPIDFRGAVIDGHISGVGRSGRVTGQSNVTFHFERITLRDGRSYDFAGYLQSIRDETGKDIRVDNEGVAKGDSQTREAAKRGGIGAGLGAIIGAIAGGGKGAAIGAVIGGSAGAGTVVVQGKDDIRLLPGSTITVQATAPTGTQYR